MKERIHVGYSQYTHDYFLLPSIGILDMVAQYPLKQHPYRFRLAFAWWNFRVSIDIGRKRGK